MVIKVGSPMLEIINFIEKKLKNLKIISELGITKKIIFSKYS